MAEVVTTLKGDGAAPWIVIHAATPAESEQLITEALGGLLQTAAEGGQLLTGAVQTVKGFSGGQQDQPPQGQANWQNGPQNGNQGQQGGNWGGGQQQQNGFIGSPNPEGKRCQMCGSVLVGKQPKVKRMWSCPNQRAQGDGHTVEWING